MAFTSTYLPNAKQRYFKFFATDGNAAAAWDDEIDEEFAPGIPVIIERIRLTLSTVHVSIVSFVAIVSNAQGSVFNDLLMSVAMLGLDSAILIPDKPLFLAHNDALQFSMEMSASNTYGIEVSGWAITQPGFD